MNASDSTVISTSRLTRLCGLRETRLRELAEEGWIPKPSRREHALAPTIAGLFRYYRDHEEKQNVQDVYESFEECSAAVGIPVKVLKRAKRKGCPALRYNRVHLPAFIRWHYQSQDQRPVDGEAARAEREALQSEKLKLELRLAKRELTPAEEVRNIGAELGHAIRKTVLRVHLLAPSLTGQPLATIEERLKDEEQGIIAQLRILDDRLRDWEVNGGK
ncbi:MAG: hypothetical protein KJ072_27210 [Verrucomicrobia bacterium]|nr:hypothetical protein [Verrucomicrobiota bacterium]